MDLQCVIWIAAIDPVVKASMMYINSCEAIVRTLVLLVHFDLFVFNMLLCYDSLNILNIDLKVENKGLWMITCKDKIVVT